MKNLLIFTAATLGKRDAVSAPTFWTTMEGFMREGWHIHIVSCDLKGTAERLTEETDGALTVTYCPVPLKKLSNKRIIGYFFGLAQCAAVTGHFRRQARRLIRQNGWTGKDTVVYADDVMAVRAGKQISRQFSLPLVTRFCGTTMCDKPYTLANRLHYYPHMQAIGTRADLVIMTNDGTKGDEVLKRTGNTSPKQFFWRNGVDFPSGTGQLPEALRALPPDDRILMTLSRLNRWKHVDRAVSALPEILERFPTARLVVCGYGPELDNLKTQAEELGVSDRVIFLGKILHEDAFACLQRAEVFLSLYDLSNLGNPLFEAMRCGKPIVTLNVGATDTVIRNGETGILLHRQELERIPEAVCALLADPAAARALGERARAFADANFWTWEERVAAEIREVSALLDDPSH